MQLLSYTTQANLGKLSQALPEKTMHLKSEKCGGGKHSKVRLTGMAAGNTLSNKLPKFVISKATSP